MIAAETGFSLVTFVELVIQSIVNNLGLGASANLRKRYLNID
ncbi:MAG: hypothetical protein OFPI_38640 [Osedax symbiont Rs2]|nr:MAG: hypothetical protein OFPI_38640 [Osedax symbiont Rs2]